MEAGEALHESGYEEEAETLLDLSHALGARDAEVSDYMDAADAMDAAFVLQEIGEDAYALNMVEVAQDLRDES